MKLSKVLENTIESDCAHSIEPLIKSKNKSDYSNLVKIVESKGKPEAEAAKARALYALGRWGDNKAATVIRKVIPNLNELERLTAADALGRLDSKTALDAVLELSEDSSSQVRKFAVHALSKFNKPDAKKRIKLMERDDPEDFVRQVAKKIGAKTKPRKPAKK